MKLEIILPSKGSHNSKKKKRQMSELFLPVGIILKCETFQN